MKVILLEDDVRYGDKGNVIEVKRGYAHNYLIPKKKAIVANKANLSMTQNMLKLQSKKIFSEKAKHQAIADKLKAITLAFKAKANLTGHLFGTITTQQAADQIKEKTGIEIDRRKVALNTHIKTEGSYSVKIKLFSEINLTLPLIVTIEQEDSKKNSKKKRTIRQKLIEEIRKDRTKEEKQETEHIEEKATDE